MSSGNSAFRAYYHAVSPILCVCLVCLLTKILSWALAVFGTDIKILVNFFLYLKCINKKIHKDN